MNHSSHHIEPSEIQSDLWKKFKSGDSASLGQLAQIHYRALYNYGTKFSSDPDLIRDCLQEMYLELWERRAFLSETAFVKSYLFKALRHKIIKENVRLKRVTHVAEAEFNNEEATVPIESIIIEGEELNHQKSKIKHIISSLSKRQQEIVYLRFYQNLEYDDIAHIMGLGRQSIANLIYRALKEIKECWLTVEYMILLLVSSFI